MALVAGVGLGSQLDCTSQALDYCFAPVAEVKRRPGDDQGLAPSKTCASSTSE